MGHAVLMYLVILSTVFAHTLQWELLYYGYLKTTAISDVKLKGL